MNYERSFIRGTIGYTLPSSCGKAVKDHSNFKSLVTSCLKELKGVKGRTFCFNNEQLLEIKRKITFEVEVEIDKDGYIYISRK